MAFERKSSWNLSWRDKSVTKKSLSEHIEECYREMSRLRLESNRAREETTKALQKIDLIRERHGDEIKAAIEAASDPFSVEVERAAKVTIKRKDQY